MLHRKRFVTLIVKQLNLVYQVHLSSTGKLIFNIHVYFLSYFIYRCTCNTYVASEEICDSDCQATKPTVSGTLSSTGKLILTTTLDNGTTITEV